jgi:deoxyadenosine/deoxycytidine kinase
MRSGIIEIIGPPGVGKTAIYDSLCKTWQFKSGWIYPEALMVDQASGFKKFFYFKLRKVLGKKISGSMPVDYGLRFAANNQALSKFYWSHLSNVQVYANEEASMRFRSAYFLFSDFCKYQAVVEQKLNIPCIINEGLLQKSFLINKDAAFMKDALASYLSLLPLPDAVFYINTNKHLIVQRLLNRKKVIASQAGRDYNGLLADTEKWQNLLDLVLEKMHSMHIPVYNVDGAKTIRENVSYLKTVLNKQLYNSYTSIPDYEINLDNGAHKLPRLNEHQA